MASRVWDGAMTLAIIGLILFVWFEMSGDIKDNTKAISEIRVEMAQMRAELVTEISNMRTALVGLISEITTEISELRVEIIRETHTNREEVSGLEHRVNSLESSRP